MLGKPKFALSTMSRGGIMPPFTDKQDFVEYCAEIHHSARMDDAAMTIRIFVSRRDWTGLLAWGVAEGLLFETEELN